MSGYDQRIKSMKRFFSFFRPFKMGRNFVFGCVLVFFLFYLFHAKLASTNNHRTELSDI